MPVPRSFLEAPATLDFPTGHVRNFGSLPPEPKKGDVFLCWEEKEGYQWTGEEWRNLGKYD